jgi:hypothetical protein
MGGYIQWHVLLEFTHIARTLIDVVKEFKELFL